MGIRVRPPYRLETLIELALVIGLALGFGSSITLPFVFPKGISPEIFWLIATGPLLIIGFWFSGQTQRLPLLFFAGFTVGCVFCLAWMARSAVSLGPMHITYGWFAYAWGLFAATVVGTFLGVAYLLISLANRTFWFEILEQEGSLCQHCGYCTTGVRSRKCPECGKTLGERRFRFALFRYIFEAAARRARVIAILSLATTVSVLSVRYFVLVRPMRSFANRFITDNQQNFSFDTFVPKVNSRARKSWTFQYGFGGSNYGFFLLSPDEPDYCLLVYYEPRPATGQAKMQIRLAFAQPTPPGFPPGIYEWDPRILCNINSPAAEQLDRDSFPAPMIRKFIARSVSAGWPMSESEASTITIYPHPALTPRDSQPVVISEEELLSQ